MGNSSSSSSRRLRTSQSAPVLFTNSPSRPLYLDQRHRDRTLHAETHALIHDLRSGRVSAHNLTFPRSISMPTSVRIHRVVDSSRTVGREKRRVPAPRLSNGQRRIEEWRARVEPYSLWDEPDNLAASHSEQQPVSHFEQRPVSPFDQRPLPPRRATGTPHARYQPAFVLPDCETTFSLNSSESSIPPLVSLPLSKREIPIYAAPNLPVSKTSFTALQDVEITFDGGRSREERVRLQGGKNAKGRVAEMRSVNMVDGRAPWL